jgi:histidinol-phosphate aminotransferase
MSPFPRSVYASLTRYSPDRRPIAVDLSDNTNRWGTHPGALQAIREARPEDLTRYPSVYADGLRAAVAQHFDVPLETVVTGCGSDDLLDSTFRAACDPGEGVAYLPPTFAMVEIFARVNGLTLLPVTREASASGSGFGPLPEPESLLDGRPGLIYICRPNNPTGEVQGADWMERLLTAADAEGDGKDDGGGPVILLDEAYADFMAEEGVGRDVGRGTGGGGSTGAGGSTIAPGSEPPNHFLRRAATSRRLVVLRTFSKAYGLAGLRVGFAVGAPEVVREIEKARGPYKVTRVSEAAAVAALEDREGWVPGIVAEARAQRAYLRAELESRGFQVLPSGANFLCLPLEEGPLGSTATADSVTAQLRKSGIAVRPFAGLPGLGDAIRISMGPRDEMDRLLNALDGMLT